MNVAFIPVRGGSKSIHLKNIKEILGKPLVYWVTNAAYQCAYIDKIYIATDSEEIRSAVRGIVQELDKTAKIEIISRSPENATDTASTELTMLEFAHDYLFENIVLIQATSPLLTSDDLYRGFELFNKNGTDSVLSVVRQKRFIWRTDSEGRASAVNYDYNDRPRRQEFDGFLVENGAFYITSRDKLLSSKCRISGVIRTVEMCEDSYFEIDEPADFLIIESLLRKRMSRCKSEN